MVNSCSNRTVYVDETIKRKKKHGLSLYCRRVVLFAKNKDEQRNMFCNVFNV